MTKVRVNVKIRAQLQNIVGVPCSIYLATKLENEMNATYPKLSRDPATGPFESGMQTRASKCSQHNIQKPLSPASDNHV
jgi:hypothetical protein